MMQSPLVRRVVALGLLLLSLAGIWLLLINPWQRAVQRLDQQIVELQSQLSRYREIESAIPHLEQELAVLKVKDGFDDRALRGPSPSLAAAEIQERINDAIQKQGGTLKATTILPTEDFGAFQRVSVTATMFADIEAVQRIFHRLEGGQAYLFIDNLDVRGRYQASASTGQSSPPAEMQVRFEICGYLAVQPS